MEKTTRRKNRITLLFILILIIADQGIKLYIQYNCMDKQFDLLGNFIAFSPYRNTKYSWFNSLINADIGFAAHVIFNVGMVILILILFDFINTRYRESRFVKVVFIPLIAGSLCSLIDKLVWNGSLDYIWLKGFFIFDLKDVYISIAEVGTLLCLIINYKGLRKFDERVFAKELMIHIKNRFRIKSDHHTN